MNHRTDHRSHRSARAPAMKRLLLAPLLALAFAMPGTADAAAPSSRYLGDSIGHLMDESNLLDYGTVDSVPGRTLEQGLAVIEGWSFAAGDTAVIELGTNDLGNPERWHFIAQIVAAIPTDVRIVWVVPSMFFTPAAAVAFLPVLEAALAGRDHTLIRWDVLGRGDLTTDTVHPNYLGQWYLSALIAQATGSLNGPLA